MTHGGERGTGSASLASSHADFDESATDISSSTSHSSFSDIMGESKTADYADTYQKQRVYATDYPEQAYLTPSSLHSGYADDNTATLGSWQSNMSDGAPTFPSPCSFNMPNARTSAPRRLYSQRPDDIIPRVSPSTRAPTTARGLLEERGDQLRDQLSQRQMRALGQLRDDFSASNSESLATSRPPVYRWELGPSSSTLYSPTKVDAPSMPFAVRPSPRSRPSNWKTYQGDRSTQANEAELDDPDRSRGPSEVEYDELFDSIFSTSDPRSDEDLLLAMLSGP